MASLSASPAAPWTAAQLTAARTVGTRHSWALQVASYITDNPSPVTAWAISYDLDESRSPFGTMRFRTTPAEASALCDPINLGLVFFLSAGYEGNRNLVFAGFPASRRRILKTTDSYSEVELTTGEDLTEGPLEADYAVPDTYTTLKAALDDFQDSAALGNNWLTGAWVAPLDAPSSAQLSTFRALDFSTGDSIGDMLRTCASALGQKVQGDHLHGYRGAAPTDYGPMPVVKVCPQYVFASASALTISPGEYTEYDRDESADAYASKLRLTAQWNSSGDLKSSTYTYDSGATAGSDQRITVKDVTIQLRPELSSGVRKLTASNPLGKAYAAAYARRTWQTTVTMRAWWWLEPGMSLTINGPDGQSDSGVVSRISVDVDAALMTVTIRPS